MSDILQRADRIAGQDRSRDYGHPRQNFQRIADLWDVYLANQPGDELRITPQDVAAMMILMKIARQQHTPKDDNLVDIAGYVKCWDMLGDECGEKEPVAPAQPVADAVDLFGPQEFQPHDDGEPTPPPVPTDSKGFWYLATPYRSYPGGMPDACRRATEQAAILFDAGISVFSPIVHTHPIAAHTATLKQESPEWVDLDMPMLEAAKGVIVCKLVGWKKSEGITREIREACRLKKPVIYMTPDEVPEQLRGNSN